MSENKNQASNRKSDLLSKEVEHIDITSFDARKIVSSMEKMSFVSRETANAANIYNEMIKDKDCTIFLTLAGSTSAAGCMHIYRDLVKYNMVDAIVATGASIIDMDFFEALGFKHYQGSQYQDDTELRNNYVDRIYDTYIDEEELQICDKIISEIDNFVNEIYKLKVTTFHSFCNNIIDEYSIEIGLTQDPYIENNIDNLYKDVIDNLWIDDFLNLNPEIIFAVNQKKISSRFGSSINKSFFVEILKNIDQENICKFQINNKYKIIDLNNYFNEFFYLNWNEFCVEWNKNGKELFLQLIELGKLIKESGGKSQIYAAKPRNDKFDQINCWIEEINTRLNSKNVIDFIYDISKDDLLYKYFYITMFRICTIFKWINKTSRVT